MISLVGVADRSADGSWRDHWAMWHLLRPVVGASFGMIAVLIFQAGVLGIGSNPTPSGAAAPGPANLTYYLVAFLVAYRESTFRELVKRLADTVLSTGTSKPSIDDFTPGQGGGGQVAIIGSSLGNTKVVNFRRDECDADDHQQFVHPGECAASRRCDRGYERCCRRQGHGRRRRRNRRCCRDHVYLRSGSGSRGDCACARTSGLDDHQVVSAYA